MVKEAYKLLKSQLGYDYSIMKDRIGMDLYGPGSSTWGNGRVVYGAWREDGDDPIWNVGGIECGFAASSTHFWDADAGDESTINIANDLNQCPLGSGIPNAYQKALKYFQGYWELFPVTEYCFEAPDGHRARLYDNTPKNIRWFQYHGLIDFYKTSYAYLYLASGAYYLQTDEGKTTKFIHYSSDGPLVLLVNAETRDNIVWEILGRVAHLLADMSVPAHIHNDPHPCWIDINYGVVHIHVENGDQYELWAGGAGTGSDGNCNNPINRIYAYDYGVSQALQQGGFINVTSKTNPLRYLFYSTNQIADHFGSLATQYAVDYGGLWNPGDNNVNYYYGSEYYSHLYSVFASLGPAVTSQSDFENSKIPTMNTAFVFSIRAIAGLLHYFATQVGLQPIYPLQVSISGPSVGPCQTATWTANASGGYPPYSYVWYQMWSSGGGGSELGSISSAGTIRPDRPIDQWWQIATGNPLQWYWCGGNGYLRVDVTDTHGTLVSAQKYIAGAGGGGGLAKMNNTNAEEMTLANEIPEIFSIGSHPNPFNPSTTITYQLPFDSRVQLSVFDALGRQIETLIDETKSAGFYLASFDASRYPSGVYFGRICVTPNMGKPFVQTIKLLLTK
jgi:hypothetical protein